MNPYLDITVELNVEQIVPHSLDRRWFWIYKNLGNSTLKASLLGWCFKSFNWSLATDNISLYNLQPFYLQSIFFGEEQALGIVHIEQALGIVHIVFTFKITD